MQRSLGLSILAGEFLHLADAAPLDEAIRLLGGVPQDPATGEGLQTQALGSFLLCMKGLSGFRHRRHGDEGDEPSTVSFDDVEEGLAGLRRLLEAHPGMLAKGWAPLAGMGRQHELWILLELSSLCCLYGETRHLFLPHSLLRRPCPCPFQCLTVRALLSLPPPLPGRCDLHRQAFEACATLACLFASEGGGGHLPAVVSSLPSLCSLTLSPHMANLSPTSAAAAPGLRLGSHPDIEAVACTLTSAKVRPPPLNLASVIGPIPRLAPFPNFPPKFSTSLSSAVLRVAAHHRHVHL